MESMAKKWGNSLGIRIPLSIANSMRIKDGTPIQIELDGETLVITRKKYDLEDMLSKVTPDNCHDEISWDEPLGSEVW